MGEQSIRFLRESTKVSFDIGHRNKIKFNIGKYDVAVQKGMLRYTDVELAKKRAAFKKRQVLSNLPELLEEFEKNALKRGVEVFWASTSEDALKKIESVVDAIGAKMIVKSKSMTTEEIGLNEHLEHIGVVNWETDLGEFIVQVAGEKPYHIVTPAMHKSKEDIDKLFHEKFSTPEGSTPEELTLFVRGYLREKFCDAGIGVTGANFLIADSGSICVTENEGNGLFSASFPSLHIVVAGIEKIIPSVNDLGLFWPLLAAHGTGQQLTVYNSIFSAAKRNNETDGPERMIVILLDNGRSKLYAQEHLYQGLSCIRCGACLNGCPIYKNVGGYTYASTYSGPIGSVITPHFNGFEPFKHLSFASTLCGKCGEVCPVKIPLPELLLYNRHLSIEQGLYGFKEKFISKVGTTVLMSRNKIDLVRGKNKQYFASLFLKKSLGESKAFPNISKSSFSEQWVKAKGKLNNNDNN
ncbi:MAG: lactate utilization protein B [Breznakibacter sp.]